MPEGTNSGVCPVPGILPHGFGVLAGGSAEAGVPWLLGAGANGSSGFFLGGSGFAGLAGGGATAYAAGHNVGIPAQGSPAILGASAGAGVSGFITNASNVEQLAGPFSTYSLNVGVGPFQFSAQLATGGGVWELGVSPPFGGITFGASASKMTTCTATPNRGQCH